MKWGETDKLVLPHEPLILVYKNGSMINAMDYPMMSPPAQWVFHPKLGLGTYYQVDKEHISYRFRDNEVNEVNEDNEEKVVTLTNL